MVQRGTVPCPRGCGAKLQLQPGKTTVIGHECKHTLEGKPFKNKNERADIFVFVGSVRTGEEDKSPVRL